MSDEPKKINRRAFLNRSAVIAAGATALGSTALSYSRTVGANDRISLGHIGIGNRGTELDWIAGRLKDKHNVEDRKSTRLNSSHVEISYAVFCLKKKKNK